MIKTKFIRKDNIMIEIETGQKIKYKSINQAKKESHRIQIKEDSALGRGSVMVE